MNNAQSIFFTSTRTNRIQHYEIDIWKDGRWEAVYVSDEPTGDCKVITFPHNYRTEKLRLRVLRSSDFPSIYEIHVIREERSRK